MVFLFCFFVKKYIILFYGKIRLIGGIHRSVFDSQVADPVPTQGFLISGRRIFVFCGGFCIPPAGLVPGHKD